MIDPYGKEQGSPHRGDNVCTNSETLSVRAVSGQSEGGNMNVSAFLHQDMQMGLKTLGTPRGLRAKAEIIGTVIGLAGGVMSGVAGALLIFAGWLTADKGAQHWLSTTGSVLLFLVVPLIILGACCMDWLEGNQPQRRSKIVRYDDEDCE
jgi:hypothetical protein